MNQLIGFIFRLPEGHPVITASEDQKPEMSIEEAIEQAEIIFEDTTDEPHTETKDVNTEMKVDVTPTISVPETITKRVSPRLKEIVDSDAKLAEELSKNPSPTPTHNLRPKRTLRHVQALKQQAKRRKRNTGKKIA